MSSVIDKKIEPSETSKQTDLFSCYEKHQENQKNVFDAYIETWNAGTEHKNLIVSSAKDSKSISFASKIEKDAPYVGSDGSPKEIDGIGIFRNTIAKTDFGDSNYSRILTQIKKGEHTIDILNPIIKNVCNRYFKKYQVILFNEIHPNVRPGYCIVYQKKDDESINLKIKFLQYLINVFSFKLKNTRFPFANCKEAELLGKKQLMLYYKAKKFGNKDIMNDWIKSITSIYSKEGIINTKEVNTNFSLSLPNSVSIVIVKETDETITYSLPLIYETRDTGFINLASMIINFHWKLKSKKNHEDIKILQIKQKILDSFKRELPDKLEFLTLSDKNSEIIKSFTEQFSEIRNNEFKNRSIKRLEEEKIKIDEEIKSDATKIILELQKYNIVMNSGEDKEIIRVKNELALARINNSYRNY